VAVRVVRRTISQPADGSDFYVTFSPDLDTDDYGVAWTLVKGASLVEIQAPTLDRTEGSFRVITTAALDDGDILEFTLVEVVPIPEDNTLIIRDTVDFVLADEVIFTYADSAEFATPVVPEVGQPYTTDVGGGITLQITAITTTGFTLKASAAFTGSVPFTAIGDSA
jgi:hypothetical protein